MKASLRPCRFLRCAPYRMRDVRATVQEFCGTFRWPTPRSQNPADIYKMASYVPMKRIAILGSTGSIGCQCLAVVEALPGRFEVVALAAGSNIALAAKQVARHRPKIVSVGTEAGARQLCDALRRARSRDKNAPQPEVLFGAEGIE